MTFLSRSSDFTQTGSFSCSHSGTDDGVNIIITRGLETVTYVNVYIVNKKPFYLKGSPPVAASPALSGLTQFGSRVAPRTRLHVWGWSESCRLFVGSQACKQSSGPWWGSKQFQIGPGPTVECLLSCLLMLIFKTAASLHIKRVSSWRGGSVSIWKTETSASTLFALVSGIFCWLALLIYVCLYWSDSCFPKSH